MSNELFQAVRPSGSFTTMRKAFLQEPSLSRASEFHGIPCILHPSERLPTGIQNDLSVFPPPYKIPLIKARLSPTAL